MASFSKSRTRSPFRFYRPNSVDGSIPSMSSSSSQFLASGFTSKTQSCMGRSITPTRGRTTSSAFSATPHSYGLSSMSSMSSGSSTLDRVDFQKAKENVSVTIRFRPLSVGEIQRGDEVAWYADGETVVRNEYNPSTMYAFDRVFGPATTTRAVYDAAARRIVCGAMEGVNSTVFAYGVTSSGKTHTMHGDHKSAGIIPLAVKDIFSMIQDTPDREFLLRVSYLEIYNEVINDLLDPAGQNLRVREDSEGTYVEGIKEEVVLSPAHALSLIAAGEEHRHVGSNNFNLLSSRSHTIFTLIIESSSRNVECEDREVTLSQLNLIDLAGSESSKTETTGLRRKEGSYINKSLLTLGTVIAKLSDGKASHIPYRDSKLTRLLQSSLSGHGRVSLICTITPASSNAEETHNTLKFAQRAKRVEMYAAPNKIFDEKSLIKKYQKEILRLKQELEQLRQGICDKPYSVTNDEEDLYILRQQLEAGQVKMQSRLEEEEQAKAALLERIQRLTKLILVSTKNSISTSLPEQSNYRRRRSFGDEQILFSPDKRNDLAPGAGGDGCDDTVIGRGDSKFCADKMAFDNCTGDATKDDRRMKRRGMLTWFKNRKSENFQIGIRTNLDAKISANASNCGQEFGEKGGYQDFTQKLDELIPITDSFPQTTQAGELFSATVSGRRPPPTGETMADQMDLLREQVKMLVGEVAFCRSSLKRMSEQAVLNPNDEQLQAQMQKIKDEIQEKTHQIQVLEQRIIGAGEAALNTSSEFKMAQTISKLMGQLNEKSFELEIKTADNRILEEQLQAVVSENSELQETIKSLQKQLASPVEKKAGHGEKGGCYYLGSHRKANQVSENSDDNGGWLRAGVVSREIRSPGSVGDDVPNFGSRRLKEVSRNFVADPGLRSQVIIQASEIEKLKQEKACLIEDKEGLQIQSKKLAEEASYAKELASAAAVELKNLAEEVTRLSFQNAKLANDLATVQGPAFSSVNGKPAGATGFVNHIAARDSQEDGKISAPCQEDTANGYPAMKTDIYNIDCWELDHDDLKRELHARIEREAGLEAALAEKEQVEAELLKRLEEANQRESDLENDLTGMWVLVARLRKERETSSELLGPEHDTSFKDMLWSESDRNLSATAQENLKSHQNAVKVKELEAGNRLLDELRGELEEERQRSADLKTIVSRLKSEELESLDIAALEDLQNLHMEALTKLCQSKARMQERLERERDSGLTDTADLLDEERNAHICKVCFEAPTAAVLLPCRHFCLCKPCAVACTECPLCRSGIADRIITFTS